MKPNPEIVHTAVSALHVDPRCTLFVGDAPSDVLAARRAGVRGIGYVKAPARRAHLFSAGAEIVIDGMGDMARAIMDAAL